MVHVVFELPAATGSVRGAREAQGRAEEKCPLATLTDVVETLGGDQKRLLSRVGPAVWGDPESQYVVVRDRMLVHLFIDLFDRLWDAASPIPWRRANDEGEDAHLLDLLSRGFKDEAIARYLGWSLRTVRRRVARLMEELGAKTRFQLGAEAVRAGRLESKGAGTATAAYQGSGPGPSQLGTNQRNG